MADGVRVTVYNDAGCPWGYSANPAFRVLEWRYGVQLEWGLVLIGLTNASTTNSRRPTGWPKEAVSGRDRRVQRHGDRRNQSHPGRRALVIWPL